MNRRDPDGDLTSWATDQGAQITGVTPHIFSGRGRGIKATRPISKGEKLIHIPASLLLTADRDEGLPSRLMRQGLPASLVRKLDESEDAGVSVHGRLAGRVCAFLLFNRSPSVASSWNPVTPRHMKDGPWRTKRAWFAVLPTPEDFEGMPIFWPEGLNEHLPDAARTLWEKQKRKFESDASGVEGWLSVLMEYRLSGGGQSGRNLEKADVERALPHIRRLYKHAWCLVNTRCFYWDFGPPVEKTTATTRSLPRKRRKLDREDCMALCPVMDCFNHKSLGEEDCEVSYSKDGFTVTSLRDIEADEELSVSYGAHTQDFLLVEYGFSLPPGTNTSDHTLLDPFLLPLLTNEQKQVLEEHGFLGSYVLDPGEGCCYRTTTALRILCMKRERWERFVAGTLDDGDDEDGLGEKGEQRDVDLLTREVLEAGVKYTKEKMRAITSNKRFAAALASFKGEGEHYGGSDGQSEQRVDEEMQEAAERKLGRQVSVLLERWVEIMEMLQGKGERLKLKASGECGGG